MVVVGMMIPVHLAAGRGVRVGAAASEPRDGLQALLGAAGARTGTAGGDHRAPLTGELRVFGMAAITRFSWHRVL
jgi:hypothetical protein